MHLRKSQAFGSVAKSKEFRIVASSQTFRFAVLESLDFYVEQSSLFSGERRKKEQLKEGMRLFRNKNRSNKLLLFECVCLHTKRKNL